MARIGVQKHILMIAYHFPPSTAAGMYRSLRFAKYLQRLGWKVSVLTICPFDHQKDSGGRIPNGVSVFRTKTFQILAPIIRMRNAIKKIIGKEKILVLQGKDIARRKTDNYYQQFKDFLSLLFSFPDASISWFPMAVFRGWQIARNSSIDIVYSSGPPHSSHLIGWALKSITGKPWVADFRDPWARQAWIKDYENQSWRKRSIEGLERRVVKAADRIILNTEPMLKNFSAYYARPLNAKLVCIPNGFDPEDFQGIKSNHWRGPFRITHTGTLYRKRNPMALLSAIHRLIQEGAITKNEIKIELIGSISLDGFSLEERKKELGLEDVVKWIPHLPHHECLLKLYQADVLLVVQPEADVQIPGKIFEYLYIGKPILALAHRGATSEFIKENKLGYVANPDHPEEVIGAFRTLYNFYQQGLSWPPAPAHLVQNYDIGRLIMKLDVVLRECVSQS